MYNIFMFLTVILLVFIIGQILIGKGRKRFLYSGVLIALILLGFSYYSIPRKLPISSSSLYEGKITIETDWRHTTLKAFSISLEDKSDFIEGLKRQDYFPSVSDRYSYNGDYYHYEITTDNYALRHDIVIMANGMGYLSTMKGTYHFKATEGFLMLLQDQKDKYELVLKEKKVYDGLNAEVNYIGMINEKHNFTLNLQAQDGLIVSEVLLFIDYLNEGNLTRTIIDSNQTFLAESIDFPTKRIMAGNEKKIYDQKLIIRGYENGVPFQSIYELDDLIASDREGL